ncbi:hypothetical protein ACFLU6_14330 [Acidobacteriota bacterium]
MDACDEAPVSGVHENDDAKWDALRQKLRQTANEKRSECRQAGQDLAKPVDEARKPTTIGSTAPPSFKAQRGSLFSDRARYMAWTLALVGSIAFSWALQPPPIPQAAAPPGSTALSLDLDITDIRVVGKTLHARVVNWHAFAPEERKEAVSRACGKAKAEGFTDMALFDEEGEFATTCAFTASKTEGIPEVAHEPEKTGGNDAR